MIDLTTPPHTVAGWSDADHSAIERDFDRLWSGWQRLLALYESGGSIRKGPGVTLGRTVIRDVATNLGTYLAHIDRLIDYEGVAGKIG